ncbi:Stk1 family PASTA domain-containing Ser/Thr kinase [Staphylococcus simiae]|uniref:Serine/threonine-protein kinase PrkC n=1 Tax=Staphylococcus simiae CCM 7213 = CCUG 51256 TaxID=911238 RepID=G5JH31_9STAP|nr:Stk1 family PASTA domain-containing Ser/Thr kinase [Staphylococcus simiae]EHJ08497.1 protein kinase [Staphylococcus simiae CCM 7213 = CCUG 51256]PNZ11915.1 serine/threonine protein kinase [Staphylococcus simiae]SNV69139.1 Serine/threonine protein kinase PrkC, regulator of stationary phase [Staphylococcus simiae]
MIGKIINERYKIIDKLGGGGMSTVYLAEDTVLEMKVAIKAISIPPSEKEATLKRFEREVHNSSQLSHENIVSMIDVAEEDDCYFLVMEYIEGPTLSEYIHNHGPLSIDTAINFTNQILNGIKEAHDMRIVHRDIKPQNILIDKHKTLKIFDFGIAKALSETSFTQTNHVLGTVQYFSPEQAKGESTDEGTDIYSIGIVLYEMLTGEPPFNGETAVSIAIKHIQESVPNITTEIRHDVPQALSNVVLRATEKDKTNRYKTIQEMKDDLSSVLHENRAQEEVYELDKMKTKAVSYSKEDIANHLNNNPKATKQTMQVPIVEGPAHHQQFQHSEEALYTGPKKKKSKKKIILYSLIFVLLVVALISFVGMAMFGNKYEETPNVLGKTVKEAETIFNQHKLKLGKISRSYSDKYAENEIIKTNPNEGERIERGDSVDVVISKGPERVTMPNVIGLSKDEAIDKLKEVGLNNITVEQMYSHNVPEGKIADQSVAAESKVKKNGSEIKIYESLGPKQVYVDDYEGKSFSKAKKALENKGFKVVSKEVYDDDVDKGDVISQSPKAKSVDEGSTISFEVSKGKDKDASSKSDSDNDSDSDKVKSTSVSVDVPFSGKKNKPQTVKVYVRDKDNNGTSPKGEFTITSDQKIDIPLKIEKGKTAGYTVRVDGRIVADKDVSYDDA